MVSGFSLHSTLFPHLSLVLARHSNSEPDTRNLNLLFTASLFTVHRSLILSLDPNPRHPSLGYNPPPQRNCQAIPSTSASVPVLVYVLVLP